MAVARLPGSLSGSIRSDRPYAGVYDAGRNIQPRAPFAESRIARVSKTLLVGNHLTNEWGPITWKSESLSHGHGVVRLGILTQPKRPMV